MKPIETHTHGSVCQILIQRPEKKNALTAQMYQLMADALVEADQNERIRAVVLAGAGEHFTAGNDLGDFLANPAMDEQSAVYQFLQAVSTCSIPVIGAVQGFSIGIGCTMLLHCERVFSDSTARFALPFINLGLVPEAGSTLLLPRLVGYQQAAHLLLSGDTFDADDALAMGLIAEKTEAGEAVSAAMAYAEKLAQKPRATLIETKKLLRRDDESLAERMRAELEVFVEKLNSPEAREAMTAFMEKRAPDFSQF